MAQGISEVLTYAIGVAISALAIITVILMLFSSRAKANGLMFLLGWVVALAAVSGAAYVISDAGDVATSSTAGNTVSWGQIVFGVLFLLLAGRSWRNRPDPGAGTEMPKWMAGIDSFAPGKALGLGLLLGAANPKNFLLEVGAGSALAVSWPSTSDAVVSLIVFVVVGSVTIAAPVVFYLVGGDRAKTPLESAKGWLVVHNDAVMTVLFLVFGVDLIAKGIPPLTG